jgi:hypothetical protein
VPVVYVELSEAEERLVLASLDPLAAMAGAEKEALAALLAGLETEDAALVAGIGRAFAMYDGRDASAHFRRCLDRPHVCWT